MPALGHIIDVQGYSSELYSSSRSNLLANLNNQFIKAAKKNDVMLFLDWILQGNIFYFALLSLSLPKQ